MCASLNKANERNLADNLLIWIRRLKITSGDHTGEPVTVLPWQESVLFEGRSGLASRLRA